jgi:branched-chain amino acid transport system ATP-binding protein
MLEVSEVTRQFGGHRAVDRVSFRLRPGTITGLIGPNGAGKTTMFNLIAGALRPTYGRIALEGRRLDRLPPHRVLACGVARTFQVPRPFPSITVLENVMVAGQGQLGERFWTNWLRPGSVGVEERAVRDRALSGGERKLLELARALMTEPRVILLDEPAAGVNPKLLSTIVERIRTLNRQGVTFLIIEHNMEVVLSLCRPVLVMASGALLLEGDPQTVRTDPRVVDAYLGRAGP